MSNNSSSYKVTIINRDLKGAPAALSESLYEFHISAEVRDKYQFADSLFSFNGNVIFADFYSVRVFTQKMNEFRDSSSKVRTGQVNAMGLLDEIFHFILREYETKANPNVFSRALSTLNSEIGSENVEKVLLRFTQAFPPVDVYKGYLTAEKYLSGSSIGRPNREVALEELILLHIANFNPANNPFFELFSDKELYENTRYGDMLSVLDGFFQNEKPFGPDNQYIFELLKTPILNNPESLEDQLKYVMNRWSMILDVKFLSKILSGMDLIKEDVRLGMFGFGGGAPTVVPKYKGEVDEADILSLGKSGYKYGKDAQLDYIEPEKFTPDLDWMPQVVLLAKNAYVWLDQLSKKYQRPINRLDQVPDEELDMLRDFHFTGLWLIGLWERSRASQKIKQMTGNPEAVPSAYSLYDYVIAYDLGGESAFENLKYRAAQRGIRLASDMVPNHMGIFSKWVVERPHYFIQSPYPPFPNYRFTGPDLSDDPSVQIRIEDGYWSKTDAAVVFQRIDNNTGEVRYIYHGNDGTNMPWNDTAQLDMLKSEVREAVIQTIFHVARKTSIIRFDAAMTLAKRHFQRLWYPQPGHGGDIPSRADHALTNERFNELFPQEFWREVVDRINAEMPDTLLLAEAFWLMEGYFVRTLGMHRVYNSAFMHMMMKEENTKYRDVISNTLEFNPEILKRYVNFMSNPDEETAIKQFGTDDKYFGVATLLVTLPGLPMFGHGQIEGFTEKYGMEYRRAYYNETPHQWLIERHQREIFPLMQKRYMFSQVSDFWFYDFIAPNGHVNENVFSFTNGYGHERAVVFYNNKFSQASGYINYSTGKAKSSGGGEVKDLDYTNLANALNVKNEDNHYYIFREHVSGLQFIRSGRELHMNGLYVELDAFKYQVYWEFREVYDTTGEYENLRNYLQGRGVPDIEMVFAELRLAPVHDALLSVFETDISELIEASFTEEIEIDAQALKKITNKYNLFLNEAARKLGIYDADLEGLTERFRLGIESVTSINEILNPKELKEENELLLDELHKTFLLTADVNYRENSLIYLLWLAAVVLERSRTDGEARLFDELMLQIPLSHILRRLGRSEADIYQDIDLLRLLSDVSPRLKAESVRAALDFDAVSEESDSANRLSAPEVEFWKELFADEKARKFLGINQYEDVWYYSKENLEDLLNWFFTTEIIKQNIAGELKEKENRKQILRFIQTAFERIGYMKSLSDKSEYKLLKLLAGITGKGEKEIKI